MALTFLSPLHKASRQISMYLEARTGELGVSPSEGHILTYLRSYAPTPVNELVRVFGIKQSTFTGILDRLEQNGFLRRELNREGRRSFLIHITDEGRDLAERLNGLLEQLEEEILRRVNEREVKGFQAVMTAVEEVTRVRLRDP